MESKEQKIAWLNSVPHLTWGREEALGGRVAYRGIHKLEGKKPHSWYYSNPADDEELCLERFVTSIKKYLSLSDNGLRS
jgi:hypothetical protein